MGYEYRVDHIVGKGEIDPINFLCSHSKIQLLYGIQFNVKERADELVPLEKQHYYDC